MRSALHTRSNFDRALEALEELAALLRLSDAERVQLELRLLESAPVEHGVRPRLSLRA